MCEFKFGDLVEFNDAGEKREGVVLSIFRGDAAVAFKDEEGDFEFVAMKYLKLIPHPDTVRLDYMGKLVAGSLGMQYDPKEHRQQIDRSMSNSN